VVHKEPAPASLEELVFRVKDVVGRLEGNASSSAAGGTEADSIVEEGHQNLNKLDATHSKATTELKRHVEEHDVVQAEQLVLKTQQQNAEKEADDLEEKAGVAWARARELRGKEAELLKRSDVCRGNIGV
jgi:hypothetical protein